MRWEAKIAANKRELKKTLIIYCRQFRARMKNTSELSETDKKKITDAINKALDWLKAHPDATIKNIQDKLDEVQATVGHIFPQIVVGQVGNLPSGTEESKPTLTQGQLRVD